MAIPMDRQDILESLSSKKRKKLPKSDFVSKKDRKYPIDTEKRAHAALSYGARYASPELYAKIKKAVHRRYPNIKIHEEDMRFSDAMLESLIRAINSGIPAHEAFDSLMEGSVGSLPLIRRQQPDATISGADRTAVRAPVQKPNLNATFSPTHHGETHLPTGRSNYGIASVSDLRQGLTLSKEQAAAKARQNWADMRSTPSTSQQDSRLRQGRQDLYNRLSEKPTEYASTSRNYRPAMKPKKASIPATKAWSPSR